MAWEFETKMHFNDEPLFEVVLDILKEYCKSSLIATRTVVTIIMICLKLPFAGDYSPSPSFTSVILATVKMAALILAQLRLLTSPVLQAARCKIVSQPLPPTSRLWLNHCRVISSTSSPSVKASESAPATDATVVDEADTVEESKLAAKLVKPKPIFPWRHSPYPIPRLVKPDINNKTDDRDGRHRRETSEDVYESDYYTKGGPLGPGWPSPMESWFRAALYANSMNLLGASWMSIIFPFTRKEWIHEMEWAFCDAFSKGVKGMLEGTYSINGDLREVDDKLDSESSFDVEFEQTIDPKPLVEKGGEQTQTKSDDTKQSNDKFEQEQEENCMLQYKLRNMYQSARQHSHPSKINILLRTQPQSAVIESMFPVFGLSRSLVENHPNLRHSYRNLVKHLQRKHKEAQSEGRSRLNPWEVGSIVMSGLDELMVQSSKLSDDRKGVITVIAQVSIQCREQFCVRDVETKEVIQGDGAPKDVTHLVRFEIVLREPLEESEDGSWEMEIGRWQITDWDDLLDGNVWFT